MNKCKWLVGFVLLLTIFMTCAPSALMADFQADFDDDGFADLVVGVPYENVSTTADAGALSVIYGTASGLDGAGDEYWVQNYLVGSASESFDLFGRRLAVGDFDGDGCFDLAVGAPYEDVGAVNQAGAVNIIYGSKFGGLDIARNQYWDQDEPYIDGAAEADDNFGEALAAGDFNGDGWDDLAVGVPGEDIGAVVDAGAVQIIYGTSAGLTASGDMIWDQDMGAETGDQYGKTLAVGDFNRDGYDDLAIGGPSEDMGSILNTGAVELLYGSDSGLVSRVSNDFWHQDRSGVADTADEHDFFGSALTTGDFDGDGYDDLAVGVPFEDVGSPEITDAGAVNILYGSETGIVGTGSDYWHQDSTGMSSLCEPNDRLGFALSAADFDGDGYADLAIGLPYEHWNLEDTGIVQVLYGTSDGLSAARDQIWRQDIPDIQDVEEANDGYGYALAAGDFNGDRIADLAVGIPYEDIGATDQAGAVNVIYGSRLGLTAIGNQFWYQGANGLQGTIEVGDRFGYALAAFARLPYVIHLPLVLRNFNQ